MNEALPEPNIPQPIIDTVKAEKSLSNRILGYAFLASVLINIGWVTWVANSDIFGSTSALIPLKETKIKVFHPIVQKPKPRPPKPLPPPPPPKQPPHVKPPPPLQIPREQPHPQPVTHTVQVARSTRSTSVIALPPVAENTAPVTPVVPTYTPGPPAPPTPPVPDNPPNPGPVVEQPKPVVEQPKPAIEQPKPVVEHHPDNWVPIDTQEASFPEGLGDNVSVDGIDSSSITNPKVVISFTIDENGRAKNVHVSESCGNNELDNRFADAVRRAHGTPAIQDHIPRDAPESLTFDINL